MGETIILRGSGRRAAISGAPFVAIPLVWACFEGVEQGALTWWGWSCLGLAAFAALTVLANILNRPMLMLGPAGFDYRWGWHRTFVPIDAIEQFKAARQQHLPSWYRWRSLHPPMVGFDYCAEAALTPNQQAARSTSKGSLGCDWAVASYWDAPIGQLLELLNTHLEALKTPSRFDTLPGA